MPLRKYLGKCSAAQRNSCQKTSDMQAIKKYRSALACKMLIRRNNRLASVHVVADIDRYGHSRAILDKQVRL